MDVCAFKMGRKSIYINGEDEESNGSAGTQDHLQGLNLEHSKKLTKRKCTSTSLNRSNCYITAKAMIFQGAKQTFTLVFGTLSTFTRE